LAAGLAIAPAVDAAAADTPADTPFAAAAVRNLARELALKPYQPPDAALPDALKSLDYSAYQTLRFDPGKALWRGDGGKFTIEFFHRGYLFKNRVDILEVVNGRASPVRYSPDFRFTVRPGAETIMDTEMTADRSPQIAAASGSQLSMRGLVTLIQ
jgi:periplasmic glucans biosynthesis protein